MMRAMQAAALGLLLSVAAFFACGAWAVVKLEPDAAQLLKRSTESAIVARDAAASVKVTADRANRLVAELQPKLQQTAANLAAVSSNLKKAAAGVDIAIAEVNRKCTTKDGCGVLATSERMLNSIRLAAGQVTAVSEGEKQQRLAMNAQETQLAASAQDAVVKLGAAIDGITALTTNKDLQGSFAHLNVALDSVAGMATETSKAWHAFLHPTWPHKVENEVRGWGTTVLKVFW